MEAALFFAIFVPIAGALVVALSGERRRRSAETFGSVSVITGGDIVLKTSALPERERRIARYRASSESRLLILND